LASREREALKTGDWTALVDVYQAEAGAVLKEQYGLDQEQVAIWQADALCRAAYVARFLQDDPGRAVTLLNQALERRPADELVQWSLQEALESSGQWEALAQLCSRLAEGSLGGRLRESMLWQLADLAAGPLKDPAREVKALAALRQTHPEDVYLAGRLVEATADLGDHEQMLEALRRVETLQSDVDQRVLYKTRRAALHETDQDWEEAARTFEEILELAPADMFATHAADRILRRLGKHRELVHLFRRILSRPDGEVSAERRAEIEHDLAQVLELDLGDHPAALALYQSLVDRCPEDSLAGDGVRRVSRLLGDDSALARQLRLDIRHLEDPGPKGRALLRLAEIEQDVLENGASASDCFDQVIRLPGAPDQVVDALCEQVYRRAGEKDHEGIITALEFLIADAPPKAHAMLLQEQAWTLALGLDRTEQATEKWRQASAASRTSWNAPLELYQLASLQRDWNSAASLVRELADRSHDETLKQMLHLRAGLLHLAQGDPDGHGLSLLRMARMSSDVATEADWAILAHPLAEAGERARALENLTPQLPEAIRGQLELPRAWALEQDGRFSAAWERLAPLLRENANHVPSLVTLMRMLRDARKDREEAAVALRLASLHPDGSEAQTDLLARAADLLSDCSEWREPAILVNRRLLANRPEDTKTFDRLERFYRDGQDYSALEALIGHRIHHSEDRRMRADGHWQRGCLRLEKLGQVRPAAQDLYEVLRLDEGHIGARSRLAQLHERDGDAQRAIDLYREILDRVSDVGERRAAVIGLTDILRRTGCYVEGISVLQEALNLAPQERECLERLVVFYRLKGETKHAIETIERVVGLTANAAEETLQLRRLAQVYGRGLKDLDRAKDCLRRAQDRTPTDGRVLRELRDVCLQSGDTQGLQQLLARAVSDLRSAVLERPLDHSLYRLLLKVAVWAEDQDLVLSLLGVLVFLRTAEPAEERLYSRRMKAVDLRPRADLPQGSFDRMICAEEAKGGFGQVWQELSDGIRGVYPNRVPASLADCGVGREQRIDPRSVGPTATLIENIARMLSAGKFDVYVRQDAAEQLDAIDTQGQRALILGHQMVSTADGRVRFALGRAIALLKLGTAQFLRLRPEESVSLILAAGQNIKVDLGKDLDRKALELIWQNLSRVLPKRQRKILPEVVASALRAGNDPQTWVKGVRLTANRAGLLVSGDIEASLDQVAADRGVERPSIEVRHGSSARDHALDDELLDLIRFALSSEYCELRRALRGGAA
jgi:tetratricopeptide (TPR) repeat protein